MRRRVGVGSVQKQQQAQAKFKDKGNEMAEDQIQQMTRQMEVFRTKLQEFAGKYKKDIRRNAEFRQQFQEMCATVGVDPLASSKGFWAKILGVGDFYYELGVQIIEVCLATKSQNGGIIRMDLLHKKIVALRGAIDKEKITHDDLQRSIEKLKVLGEGFSLIHTENGVLVQSVPAELSMDHPQVYQNAQNGFTSVSNLCNQLKWTPERSLIVLEDLVKCGIAWVDDYKKQERLYWFPGMLKTEAK